MKKQVYSIALAGMLIGSMPMLQAQKGNTTKVGSISILPSVSTTKEATSAKPPILNIVDGTLQFVDATGNRAIDANEKCKIIFQVSNTGYGDGVGCTALISGVGTTGGVVYKSQKLNTIKRGSTEWVEIPISSYSHTVDGSITFTVQVDEPMGMGTDAIEISVSTKAFETPLVKVADYTVTGTQSSTLEKKKPFVLQVLVQNTRHGMADNVTVDVEIPENIGLLDGITSTEIGTLKGGEVKSMEYTLIATNNYVNATIPVSFKINEKYGLYAENRTIDLALNQTFSSKKIEVEAVPTDYEEIELASLGSDVDKNIPQAKSVNRNTFAFIIANEQYLNKGFSTVNYALNDGKVFADYCRQTLGIPADQVSLNNNLTYGGLRGLINRIKDIAAVNENAHIIFYYAGHGAPIEGTNEAYLVPVDAPKVDPAICYSMQLLYRELGDLPAGQVTVFLDACFSGTDRNSNLLASARGVAVRAKVGKVTGNVVVFSAATEDQTAQPYNKENHGLFTYYLLKKLQESRGEVTYGDLNRYLNTEVKRTSVNKNNKLQEPTVNPSTTLGEQWQEWKLF